MWKIFAWQFCDRLGSSWQKVVIVKTMFLKATHREFPPSWFPLPLLFFKKHKGWWKSSLKFPNWTVSKSYNTNPLKRTVFILLFCKGFLLQPSPAPVLLGQSQKTRSEEEEQPTSSSSFPLPAALLLDHGSPVHPSPPATQLSFAIVSVPGEGTTRLPPPLPLCRHNLLYPGPSEQFTFSHQSPASPPYRLRSYRYIKIPASNVNEWFAGGTTENTAVPFSCSHTKLRVCSILRTPPTFWFFP